MPLLQKLFSWTATEVGIWMSNYVPYKTVGVITLYILIQINLSVINWASGGLIQYKDVMNDKMVSWLSDPYHGNPHTWYDDVYIETGPL